MALMYFWFALKHIRDDCDIQATKQEDRFHCWPYMLGFVDYIPGHYLSTWVQGKAGDEGLQLIGNSTGVRNEI